MVPLTTDQIASALFGPLVQTLRRRVTDADAGSLEGLFARLVLRPDLAEVGPPSADVVDETMPIPRALACWGYLAELGTDTCAVRPSIEAGLVELQRRDPFPDHRVSFVYDPTLTVGICAAARHIRDTSPGTISWLSKTLRDPRLPVDFSFQSLGRAFALFTVTGEPAEITHAVAATTDAGELAFALWLVATGRGRLTDTRDSLAHLTERLLTAAFEWDPGQLPVPRAAIVLAALRHIAGTTARQLADGPGAVSAILNRFDAAMERWRWDSDDLRDPVQWRIDAEREVQDILWVMLRPAFDDLTYEDPLPKIGHASYRTDFGIPSLRLLIEVKYVRDASAFRAVEQEVMVDAHAYLDQTDSYDQIIVFIYDDSASPEHHATTRRAILDIPGIIDVIICSRPGRIPNRVTRSQAAAPAPKARVTRQPTVRAAKPTQPGP